MVNKQLAKMSFDDILELTGGVPFISIFTNSFQADQILTTSTSSGELLPALTFHPAAMLASPPQLSGPFTRFSPPDVRGELPRSGALVMDHPVCRGVIFIDNQQAVRHDKGEVIAEFVGLLLHNANQANQAIAAEDGEGRERHSEAGKGGWTKLGAGRGIGGSGGSGVGGGGGGGEIGAGSRGRRRKCILVDNTSKKCERASESFARHAASEFLELHTLHFTEAENLVESPDAVNQLRRILGRLRARGLIGVDLVAEDILVSPESSGRFRTAVSAAAGADSKEGVVAEPQRG